MKSLESIFGTETSLEKDGVWESFGDASFKIASMMPGNPDYLKAQERVFRSKRRAIEADAVSIAEYQRLMTEILATAVVRDWKNVQYKGENLPFTRENVMRVLTDLPALADAITKVASSRGSYQSADIETDTKN